MDTIEFITEGASDYLEEMLQASVYHSRELANTILEQMDAESQMIIATLESMEIVFEEVQNTQQKKKGIFANIIDFIKRIFGSFAGKVTSLVQRDEAFLNDNSTKFQNVNYSGLEITMNPFWNMDVAKSKSISSNILKETQRIIFNAKKTQKYQDLETVKKNIFGRYMDSDGNLSNGLKNYYRSGNARGVSPVKLEGDSLKTKVIQEFIPYCQNYSKVVLPAIKQLSDEIARSLEIITKELDDRNKPVSEMYCLVEDGLYRDTELSYLGVFEAEVPKNEQSEKKEPTNSATNSGTSTGDADKKQSATKVEVNDKERQNRDESTKDAAKSMDKSQLTFFHNIAQIEQMSITAFMTVSEEKYIAYMNALRQIIKTRPVKNNGDSPDNKSKNDDPNTEPSTAAHEVKVNEKKTVRQRISNAANKVKNKK